MALILLEPRTVRSPTRPLYSPPHSRGWVRVEGRYSPRAVGEGQDGGLYSPPPLGEGGVGASASTSASTPSTPPTIGRNPPTPAFKWIAARPTFPTATSPASPSVAARAPRCYARA